MKLKLNYMYRLQKEKFNMGRFFAVIEGYDNKEVNLPKRSTQHSAGYDFEAVEDILIPSVWRSYTDLLVRRPTHKLVNEEGITERTVPEYFQMGYYPINRVGFKPTLVPTGIKANMEADEKLDLYNRSSNPKNGLVLANGVGLVDSDYFENPSNDGHIFFAFINFGEEDYQVKKGDRIGQGVFSKYLVVDNDNATGQRVSGFGSTGV